MDKEPVVFIVDDDAAVRDAIERLVTSVALKSQCYSSAEDFLKEYDIDTPGCLILDVRMHGMSGLELQDWLIQNHSPIPVIVVTGHGDIPMAVELLKKGAFDIYEKPFRNQTLLDCVMKAIKEDQEKRANLEVTRSLMDKYSSLTGREQEVANYIIKGVANKRIASELNLSPRTVETHRANIMKKMGVRTSNRLLNALLQVAGPQSTTID